ncbi:hypothetical protein KEM54_005691 [Ascosphaera aggregata]|nr:hypothetical protein KEM54_005691 [Ascosphaera aggregata]
MSDASDADKIRSKRLAKLSGSASAAQPDPGDASSSTHAPSSGHVRAQAHAPVRPQEPAKAPSKRAEETKKTPLKIHQPSPIPQSSSPQSSRSSKPASTRPPESLEEFEDRTLRSVLRVTLEEERRVDLQGNQLIFLPSLKQELSADGLPLKFRVSHLDQTILEAASSTPNNKPLDYLIPCWKRISALLSNFKRTLDNGQKYYALTETKRLCLSYCIFGFTMLDIFGLEMPEDGAILKPYLLRDPSDERGIDPDFLQESMHIADEDESIIPAYLEALESISKDAIGLSMSNPDFQKPMRVLRSLVRVPKLAIAITHCQSFNQPNIEANMLEYDTLLGPFFGISPLQGEQPIATFAMAKSLSKEHIRAGQASIRMLQQSHASELFDVINHLLRASKSSRDKVLDWFASAINKNHKRRAMRVDHNLVASHGFMLNITTVLDLLCEPFMDARFSKIDKIEAEYLRRKSRLLVRDETKLNADQKTADEFYSHTVGGTSPFISELFFLTVAAHHYGSAGISHDLDHIQKQMRYLKQDIERLEHELQAGDNSPPNARATRMMLQRYQNVYDRGLATMYAFQGILADDLWQARAMQFMRYIIVWIMRLVSGKNYPHEPLELPLPEEKNMIFSCLPEYFVEDIVDSFKFIMRTMPHIVTTTQAEELLTMCLAFLQSSDYIKNPYLKAGLVTILCAGALGKYVGEEGVFAPLMNSMPFCNQYLLHSLMKFYIEAEFTGTHTQFYDKFNIRYEIFQIIKVIWPNQWYRDKLQAEAKDNQDFFIQFVNLLLNDVTFVLDESLSAFVTINQVGRELTIEGAQMDDNVRKEKEELLHSAKGKAKGYMQLTNETVSMLGLFTKALATSFTMPEIVQRLADMLDYNLDAMVGPKSSSLKVENPAEYGFRPRELLSGLVDVYLNLMGKENFVLAVARDGRSYKPANFAKAKSILSKWALKSPEELALWQQFQEKVRTMKEVDEQAEEDLGEVPDEFLDPLMYTLMEDPVILPQSKVSIDRATIRSHLLSDPNDPFNRMPLKIEDVIADTELKAKIEAFKAERRAATRKGAGSNVKDVDKMDTSED